MLNLEFKKNCFCSANGFDDLKNKKYFLVKHFEGSKGGCGLWHHVWKTSKEDADKDIEDRGGVVTMNDLKFRKMTLASFCEENRRLFEYNESYKWDGKSKEFLPRFSCRHVAEFNFNELQRVVEYIETGGSYRFIQMALAQNKIVIKDEFGEYYGVQCGRYYIVEVDKDGDTICTCEHIPLYFQPTFTKKKDTASDLIGKSLKDITTPPDADREVCI